MPTSERPDPQAVDQAIEWLVRLKFDLPSAATSRDFQQWLQEYPQHQVAWRRVSSLSDEFAALPASASRRVLGAAQGAGLSRRAGLKLLALLAGVGGLGWSARDELGMAGLLADVRTTTGERRRLLPEDGSDILLNTRSAVDLALEADQRTLTLIEGEAIVAAGADSGMPAPRPFWLVTRDARLRLLDSHLLIRQRERDTVLAVAGGALDVFASGQVDNAPLRTLKPGDSLTVSADGRLSSWEAHGDPWAWREGVLSVQNMPLGDFLRELGRYRSGVIRCQAEVAGLPVSGTWQLADTDAILALLGRVLPVRVDYRTRYWVTFGAV